MAKKSSITIGYTAFEKSSDPRIYKAAFTRSRYADTADYPSLVISYEGARDAVVLLAHSWYVESSYSRSQSGDVVLNGEQVRYFEKLGSHGLRLEYSGPDTSNQKVVVSDQVTCAPDSMGSHPPPPDLPNICPSGFIHGGFKLELFESSTALVDLPQFGSLSVDAVYVPYALDFPLGDGPWPGFSATENFAMRATAMLRIETSGTYKFFLSSDDGSKLFIQGSLVVDNNSPPQHGYGMVQGTYSFSSAGFYEIEVKD